jgi:cell division protein FtsI (penicillin-binding protein 3)
MLGAMLEGLPAWSFEDRNRRTYPFGTLTGQLVGLIGMSGRENDDEVAGRVGIELFLERALAGEPGQLSGVQDAAGQELVIADPWARPPRRGADVVLTVDAEIQRFVAEALASGAAETGPEVASAVVLDVRSGEILGAASWPAADPNDLRESDVEGLKLPAFQARYAPGSTIKPLMLGWAFAHGVLDPEERFDCGGTAGSDRIGPRTVVEYSANPGLLTPREILMRSSNVGATRIAVGRLGLAGMYTLLDALGWGGRPGNDALQEAAGIGPRDGIAFPYVAPGYFTRHDLGARPIGVSDPPLRGPPAYTEVAFPQGYEIAVSPLAVARAYVCLARGGELIEPRLLREITWEGGAWQPPESVRRVFPEQATARVREGMVLAVEEPRGTAHKSRSDRWTTAAKTGTAQVTTPGEVGRRSLYNAWFCCLAPASDPRLVVVVHHQLRHRPGDPYTGGAVSGPVGKEIFERTLEYLGVPPDRERVEVREQGR